jgi:uncharacterized protein YegP (UPF0339 family)
MAAAFVLTQGSTGKDHFNFATPNGQVIASSESNESKASAPGHGVGQTQRARR